MLDDYDTRFLTQDMIDAIIEIWDSPTSDTQRLTTNERQQHQGIGEALLATTHREPGLSTFLSKPQWSTHRY